MPSLNITLCFIVLFLISQSSSSSTVLAIDDDQYYYYCPNTTTTYNITNYNSYDSNLNKLLSTLSTASREYRFNNTYVGGNGNSERIYGLFMCQADIAIVKCQDFVTIAVKEIIKLCPGLKTAVYWWGNCLLRYSNREIFPDPDYRSIINKPYIPFIINNTYKITTDEHEQRRFKQRLGGMMVDVATRAASDQSIYQKFATKEKNFSVNITIYAFAQCIPYMSSFDCLSCLQNAIKVVQKCCDVYRGATVQFPSCFMRHEVYSFYHTNQLALPHNQGTFLPLIYPSH